MDISSAEPVTRKRKETRYDRDQRLLLEIQEWKDVADEMISLAEKFNEDNKEKEEIIEKRNTRIAEWEKYCGVLEKRLKIWNVIFEPDEIKDAIMTRGAMELYKDFAEDDDSSSSSSSDIDDEEEVEDDEEGNEDEEEISSLSS